MSKEAELEAIEEVSKRCARLSTVIVTPVFLGSLLLAVPLFFVLRDVEVWILGGWYELKSLVFGAVVPPGALGIFVARALSKKLVHQRRPTYIHEAAQSRGLDPSTIAESFGDWD